MGIRSSVKAVIIREDKLLVTKNRHKNGSVFYILPGGGQETEEDMISALRRECREEISVEIEVEDLIFVRDYIGKNHEFHIGGTGLHQIEYMFRCTIAHDAVPVDGNHPDDPGQIGIEWLPLEDLSSYPLYPSVLKRCITSPEEYPVYLGDIN